MEQSILFRDSQLVMSKIYLPDPTFISVNFCTKKSTKMCQIQLISVHILSKTLHIREEVKLRSLILVLTLKSKTCYKWQKGRKCTICLPGRL